MFTVLVTFLNLLFFRMLPLILNKYSLLSINLYLWFLIPFRETSKLYKPQAPQNLPLVMASLWRATFQLNHKESEGNIHKKKNLGPWKEHVKGLEVTMSLEASSIRPQVPLISNNTCLIIKIRHVHCSKFEKIGET